MKKRISLEEVIDTTVTLEDGTPVGQVTSASIEGDDIIVNVEVHSNVADFFRGVADFSIGPLHGEEKDPE